jgi:hypothetical protein
MKDQLKFGKKQFLFLILIIMNSIISGNLIAQEGNQSKNQPSDSSMTHQMEMIHSKSHLVMPFDMNKVTHYFIKNDNGGVLMIRAKYPEDSTQIPLIKEHLNKEKNLFSEGDFNDPKSLHGTDMPGVKTLSESKGKFNIEYKTLSDGAKLIFDSKDSTVINAIHKWFDAQLKDHGSDAKSKE